MARVHEDQTAEISFLENGPTGAATTVVLAHGAGASMDTPFMEAIAGGLAAAGLHAARFEFPYMVRSRADGRRRPPDREPRLRETWLRAIQSQSAPRLVIGGKSMGGRIASLIADEAGVAGLVCLGYPFHPTGKPDRLRIEHLKGIKTPTLILQGTRDPFGNQDEVASYELSKNIQLHWLDDGDHSFKPRQSSGRTQQQNCSAAVTAIEQFVKTLGKPRKG